MSKDFILRDDKFLHGVKPVYLNGVEQRGLRAVFNQDPLKAQRFSLDDIYWHREQYPHITGRFVRLDAELKRIAKVKSRAV